MFQSHARIARIFCGKLRRPTSLSMGSLLHLRYLEHTVCHTIASRPKHSRRACERPLWHLGTQRACFPLLQNFSRMCKKIRSATRTKNAVALEIIVFYYARSSGNTNLAFSKPCLCLSDTRHFRQFRCFRGSEERNPCFNGKNASLSFSLFSSKCPFLAGDKNTVNQKHGLCHPE